MQPELDAGADAFSFVPIVLPCFFSFQGFGGSSRSAATYDLKGDLNEQVREAVKAGDLAGVQQLLAAGASAKYIDRTGNALVVSSNTRYYSRQRIRAGSLLISSSPCVFALSLTFP
jgi:hypothetical protein